MGKAAGSSPRCSKEAPSHLRPELSTAVGWTEYSHGHHGAGAPPVGPVRGLRLGVGGGQTGVAGLHSNTNTETGQMASMAGWGNDEVDS